MDRNPPRGGRFGFQPYPARHPWGGRRFLLPLFPWRRRGYAIHTDTFITGWWTYTAAITGERMTIKSASGIRLTLASAWVEPRKPEKVEDAWP